MLRGLFQAKSPTNRNADEGPETPDDLVRRVDEDRWLAARFADAPTRERLSALYAFVYEVARIPEAVREPALGAVRLQWWREAVAKVYAGRIDADNEIVTGLAGLVEWADLDRALIEALIDAREKDLEDRPFEHWPEFEAYVDDTAGAVIKLAAKICAPDLVQTGQHRALFQNAGRIWGYTGLVRALPVWNERRRTFFPQRLLDHVHLSQETLYSGMTLHETSAACRAVLERAVSAHREVRRLAFVAPKEFFPAFGYVALVPDYMRALDRPYDGVAKLPLLRRQVRLLIASATGQV
ncbi:MAG: squalene/phytoene synthase family protein [Hyphomonadaceae bacterium]|nr:squalene/phytoene synthase family protein [Hyphomonadaceae bacterium]